ncbi:MAG TPA: hypothetical protein PLL66_09075, partial [Bacteroidales bacterium]|nr:hypothetical protein [Bacteroidales bacterium]
MKRTFIVIICLIFIGVYHANAQVYQLPNGGFEFWDGTGSDDEPSNWNSFPSAECTLIFGCGTATATRHSKSSDIRPGSSGNFSCKIYSTSALGIIANGNISTGQIRIGSTTPTNFEENYNITRSTDANFRQAINAKPDSIRFWAKFVCPSATQNARMHAIIHNNYSYKDPEDGDANAGSHVVADAVSNFTRDNQEWTLHSIPFDYNYPANEPAYILLTFTTNMVAGQGSTSDALYIDDIEFVYNTLLSDLKINGISIDDFNPYTYDYYFDAECGQTQTVSASTQSPNASISIVQNSGSNPATITITSGDQSSVYHVYFDYSHTTYINDDICTGTQYNGNGFDISPIDIPDIYEFGRTSYESEECDSLIILYLNVHPSYIADTINIMVCEGANYNFYGQTLTEAGIYNTIIP